MGGLLQYSGERQWPSTERGVIVAEGINQTTTMQQTKNEIRPVGCAYLLGFDKGHPYGDRSCLSIGITPEQHAAMMRANVPPGDEEGNKVKLNLMEISDRIHAEDPKCIIHVFIRQPNDERTCADD